MHALDWIILIAPLAISACIAIYSRRYVRGVADFMAGGRHAGRYLICTARAELGGGGFVSQFQVLLVAGFTLSWFNQVSVPLQLFLAIAGFVIYRYRQTRALTLGQFFEARYSRNFRLFAGFLGFFAGLLNFGIIPVLGARFMVYFLNLPQTTSLGGLQIPTDAIVLVILLVIAVVMTIAGGQVSVLLTDCAEGMISQLFYTFIALTLIFAFFSWSQTREALLSAPAGKSMVNPFDTREADTFNVWFVLMNIFLGVVYRTIAWQNAHAFNSSAASPHEARMGNILGRWRQFAQTVMVTLLTVCVLTYLKTEAGSAAVQAVLDRIQDPSTRDQMRAPIALTQLLPIGVKGAFASICLMGMIAGNGMHMHSWGSIFIQDIVMPLRKQPLAPAQHLTLLRLAVVGVAIWAFFFGTFVPQTKYVALWWAVTEAVFVSGAGIAIIGGLYWSRGTTAAAWVALILGAVLTLGGIGLHEYDVRVLHREPFHLLHVAFFVTLFAVACYAVVSFLTCREPHNMDKLLHRGQYAVEGDATARPSGRKVSLLYRIFTLGIDHHFSRADRIITIGITCWSMTWFTVFAIGSIVYMIHPWPNQVWAGYWLIQAIYLPLVIGVVTTIWFTIGSFRDMRIFFRRLREEAVNSADDGRVTNPEPDAATVCQKN